MYSVQRCFWRALRGLRGLWLRPLQRPLPPSRELPLSLQLSPVRGQEPKAPPPLSGKMTTTDNKGYPIWHRADSKDILFSCGQLLAECSCATSKRGEQSRVWETGEVDREGWCDGEVWGSTVTRRKKAPDPSHSLMKHSRLCSEGQTSIMEHMMYSWRPNNRWTCIS